MTRSQSLLFSILAFAAYAYAISHAHRGHLSNNVWRQAANKASTSSVIAQMFEWNWNSIATECTDFLGPAGYSYVQVSPATEHIQGTQWWTDYQVVSYNLTSKRGNQAEYQNMITTCHAAGVKVIADTIWNHMTAQNSGVGVAGSNFTYYNYPIYNSSNFHYCGLEPNNNIVNYNNEQEVWTCQLDGLADLATETEYVRAQLAAFTNTMLSLGVDGLRLDAAKHIQPKDITNIKARLKGTPYITQEVVYGGAVTPEMYTSIGQVQEFRYTTAFRGAFLQNGIQALQNLDDEGWVASQNANIFVSNQDTERALSSLNAYSPSNTYTLASILSLAHTYGTPSVLSSYSGFYDADAGGPNGGTGTCWDTVDVNTWFCQHRWPAIAGMVGFRNHVGNAALKGWVSPSSQQIAFARGSLGFVALNNMDTAWNATFATNLAAGSYCNVIEGPSNSGSCSGTAFSVTRGGSLTVTIEPRQAIAMHTGAKGVGLPAPPTPQLVSVIFNENATTTFGENVLVVGSLPQLGNWNPANAIPLDSTNYPTWGATVYLPPNTEFEYKFIRSESDGSIEWESDPNRQDTTPAYGVQLIGMTSWR